MNEKSKRKYYITYSVFWVLFIVLFTLASNTHADTLLRKGSQIELSFKPSALVTQKAVRLDKMLKIDTLNLRLKVRLNNLMFDQLPKPGVSSRITQAQVNQWLVKQMPSLAGRLTWRGANVLTLRRQGKKLAETRIVNVAEKALEQALAKRYPKVEVNLIDYPKPVYYPSGQLRLKATVPPMSRITERHSVFVDVMVDNKKVTRVVVWFKVAVYQTVLKLTRNLPAHSVIQPADVALTFSDIAPLANHPLPVNFALARYWTNIPLKKDDILQERMLVRLPDVRYGQMVSVIVKAQGVVLKTSGKALSNGNVGRRVFIRNEKSGQRYQALVVKPGVVMVN